MFHGVVRRADAIVGRMLGIAALAIALTGCASFSSPADFKPVDPSRAAVDLVEPVTYRYGFGLGVKQEATLQGGQYRALGDDGSGIWYLGKPGALMLTILDRGGAIGFPEHLVGVPMYRDGGIFVPHDAAQSAKVFWVYIGPIPAPVTTPPTAYASTTGAALATPDAATTLAVTQGAIAGVPALANASPVAAGAGAGIGMGIAGAMADSDKANYGKLWILAWQPEESGAIRKRLKAR